MRARGLRRGAVSLLVGVIAFAAVAALVVTLMVGIFGGEVSEGNGWRLAYRVKGPSAISVVILDPNYGYSPDILRSAVEAACDTQVKRKCEVLFYPKGAIYPPRTSSLKVWERRGGAYCCQPAYSFSRGIEESGEVWRKADPAQPGASAVFVP